MRRIEQPPSLPPRPLEGHKGVFGRVLIVGGNRDMLGAPMLAAEAAFRCGCGLVQVALPRPLLATALTICPEATGLGLTKGQDRGRLEAAARASDVVVVGPGMGQTRDAHDRLRSLIRMDRPLLLDADALNLLSLARRWPGRFDAPAILTPHPGEMRRLAPLADLDDVPDDDSGRMHVALQAARRFGQVVVLKGHHTVIAEPPTTVQPVQSPRVYMNTTGDSSLSKAGTGDVLAGMIASFWAQGLDRFEAACLAVFLHGRAGELAGTRLGRRSVLARDVIASIPASIREFESQRI